jgi:hypothetical protein
MPAPRLPLPVTGAGTPFMSSALATIENRGLALRSKKRKHSDALIQKHVLILETLAKVNGGTLPSCKWMNDHGYFHSYDISCQYPAAFAHIQRETEKKYEIYKAHNSAVAELLPPVKHQILAPAKYKSISDYDVQGARFSPTELRISEGISEHEWLDIGRAITHIQQSGFFWVGDWCMYGFKVFGKKVTNDLATQATGYGRHVLRACLYVARRFPPERRREELTFHHHMVLCKFLPELADKLLAEAVEYGYTGKQIREMADEAVGKKKREKGHKVSFRLPDYMYDELIDRATGELRWFIPQIIITEWLERKREGKK